MSLQRYLWALTATLAFAGPCLGQDPREGSGGWQWTYRPQISHAVVAFFEASSGRLKDVYTVVAGSPCGAQPEADSAFVRRATAFLQVVQWPGWDSSQKVVRRYGGDLVVVTFVLGDPGAVVVFHPDGGMLFAASSMWNGTGYQLWPADPLPPWVWHLERDMAPPPAGVTAVHPVPDSILESFRRLNVIHDLSSQPYSVAALHYSRGRPFPLDASWIVMGIRRASCSQPRRAR